MDNVKSKKVKKQWQDIQDYQLLESYKASLNRARSITAGTCGGGTVEISMRGDGQQYLWMTLQPAEVVEFIHQLSAQIGCHISIKPRNDFSSYRGWKGIDEKHIFSDTLGATHAPFQLPADNFYTIGSATNKTPPPPELLNLPNASQTETNKIKVGLIKKKNKKQLVKNNKEETNEVVAPQKN